MLSIGAMGSGQGTYYVGLAREDYYLEGGEPPGRWIGAGAERLGLTGQVEKESFLRLFQGFDGDGNKLVQNAGKDDRQPGWDLTFSAPKSVSLVWALSDPATRQAIAEAHFAAVKEAAAFIEDGATTRRGKGGEVKEKADLVIATFEHGTSRAQDPQLHTHALVLNLAVRESDGTKGTVESKSFYQAKMTAGALYRAELAHGLEALGYAVERTGSTFEVKGVPDSLLKETSKRRAEIEAALESRGESGARASAFAALDTRTVKEHVPRDGLFTAWRAAGVAHDFGEPELKALRHGPRETRELRAQVREVMDRAMSRLTEDASHFSERDLLRAAAEESQGRGVWASLVRTAVAHEMTANQEIVYLGDVQGERRYTTRALLEVEKALLVDVEGMRGGKRHGVDERTLQAAITRTEREETKKALAKDPEAVRREMNKEQREALAHITQREGSIAAVSGMAGTGKTFLLQAAREAWEASGYKVLGASVAGKAARGLEEGAGISSTTLHRVLNPSNFDPSPGVVRTAKAEFKHATWQIDGTTKQKMLGTYHKPTSELAHEWKYATYQISKKHRDFLNLQLEVDKFKLDSKTVLVIDEAGMVGTRAMAQLVAKVKEAGAKLVLVGDARQLQPVEVGGPFRAIEERIGSAKLTSIVRQQLDTKDKNPLWRREAVTDFADGRADKALKAYEERGFLSVKSDREEAAKALVQTWKEKGTAKPGENLIFAGTRDEVKELNHMAQAARDVDKKLGFRSVRMNGETIHEKDRILITRNDGALDVRNGDLGTVKALDQIRSRMVVQLDDGRKVSLPYKEFSHVELGYAMTTHKSQGATVKNSYILCGGPMAARELSYVQASRATQDTHFFTEKITVWNPKTELREDRTLPELSRQMSASRQKDLAHDVAKQHEQARTQNPVLVPERVPSAGQRPERELLPEM